MLFSCLAKIHYRNSVFGVSMVIFVARMVYIQKEVFNYVSKHVYNYTITHEYIHTCTDSQVVSRSLDVDMTNVVDLRMSCGVKISVAESCRLIQE